jgi:DNA-binding LacI/PurR family transcriptional regulator
LTTISDVARAAGVSKGTVSNVFSNKRPISKEVRERVLTIAEQLNYKPNYWARSLVMKQTRIIGLNMKAEKVKFSQFHLALINGVLNACYERGYRLLVNTLSENYKQQVEHQVSDPVDGEILLDPAVSDPRIEDRIAQKIPLVVIGKPPKKYESILSYVDNNNISAAEKVTEYLLSLGHKEILFLNAPTFRTVCKDREQGYYNALKEEGISVRPGLIISTDGKLTSIDFGYEKTKKVLKDRPEITAIITDTDKMALGAYRAAAELGRQIPEDLSIVAFSDDSVYAAEFSPPLTSVRLNGEMLGSEAAKLLIDQLGSDQPLAKRVVVPTEFIKRGSCLEVNRTSKQTTKLID